MGRTRSEGGAALVEMAIVLPLVVLLLFGIIEASYAFAQANDVRHGAREGARIAAVDFGDIATIGAETCSRMDLAKGPVITLGPADDASDSGERGTVGRITVSMTYSSLTGFIDAFGSDITLSSDIDFVLEQPQSGEAQWWNGGSGGSYTC
jgi:Flp pilus assembly protein TadG